MFQESIKCGYESVSESGLKFSFHSAFSAPPCVCPPYWGQEPNQVAKKGKSPVSGLWIRIRIGSGFNDFEHLDPDSKSGSRDKKNVITERFCFGSGSALDPNSLTLSIRIQIRIESIRSHNPGKLSLLSLYEAYSTEVNYTPFQYPSL
jgi:hypothetical protein